MRIERSPRTASGTTVCDKAACPPRQCQPALARRRLHHANLTRSNYDSHINGLHRFYKEKSRAYGSNGDSVEMSMTLSSVSVIIPVYNARRYLREAIDSVLDQTLQPGQFIIVYDGSTDDSLEIARSYGSAVTIISQTNGGTAAAQIGGLKRRTSP